MPSTPPLSSTQRPPRSLQPDPPPVIRRPLDCLQLDPRNPRIHTRRQIKQIAQSIEAFGFNVPVLIDRSNKVIAGHGRVLACRFLGWDDVPTLCLEHLSEAQARAFMLADNKLTENSKWDGRLLGEQLRDLSLVDLDFSLEATGFDMGEIDLLIEGLEDHAPGGDDLADTLPEPSGKATVSQLGDLWLLGEHRLRCGNALEESVYEHLLGERRAAVIFTDPPYNVPIEGHVGGLGSIHHREFAMASGEMSEAAFTQFLKGVLAHLARYSVEGSIHYVCMDWRHLKELLTAGYATYDELKNLCVWAKDNGGMGSLYRSAHELILVWKKGKAPHQNHVQLGQFGRYRTNVWRYPGVNSFSGRDKHTNLLELHPTVKPVNLVADALKDTSSRGDVVLDAFLGSGTTLLAAEKTGRICCGVELDPLYVDTAIRRWQAYTGQAAIHAERGATFDTLQEASGG